MKYFAVTGRVRARSSFLLLMGGVLLLSLGWTAAVRCQDLSITEFMADSDFGLVDEDGEPQDWIELYNPHDETVSLAGWHLTDDASDLTRWTFTGGSLGPRSFVVVFASGKDRRDPAAEWHTNFKLEQSGEYLALVRPDGVTRSTEFSPQYPPQLAGASYGMGMTAERLTLVPESWPGRLRVPEDASEGLDWVGAGYAETGWVPVQLGIGYERPEAGGGDPDPPVADVTGPGDLIQPTSFNSPGNEVSAMAIDDDPATKYLNFDELNAGFTVIPGAGPTVVVGLRLTSANDAPERDPISFALAGSDDGVQFTPIAGGAIPDFTARFFTVEMRFPNERAYRQYRLLFPEVRNAAAAVAVQIAEVEFLGRVGVPPPRFTELIRTEVEGLMYGRNTSAYVRIPFGLAEVKPWNDLFLKVRYDDGFAAYLNGVPVARANAPAELTFEASAVSDRPRSDAVQAENFPVAGGSGLLRVGLNVLAFHALNDRLDSPDFLLSAELVNQREELGAPGYFGEPTPGGFNAGSSQGRVAEPVPDSGRGFYSGPIEVSWSSATPGVEIRYTTDGRQPSPTVGEVYAGPVRVTRSGPVRAMAYKAGWLPSATVTHTYLFVEDIVRQSTADAVARGFPALWGSTDADYDMDPRVVAPNGQDAYGGVYARTVRDDLLALPSISLVMPLADWFGPSGIYSNPENRGDAWERAVSFEVIEPGEPGGGLQVNAGLRIQGGAFRRFDLTKKKSFRVVFRKAYGPGTLKHRLFGPEAAEEFNNFILRANSNDAWPWGGGNALYVRDAFAMETARAMGMVSSHTRFMHLYINGLYWGLYNPVERPDAAFSATYHGGERESWDALNQDGLVDGTVEAWNRMLGVLGEGMSDNEVYQRIQGLNPDGTRDPAYADLLDIDNLIDYITLNLYLGNGDWPHRNYWVGRERAGGEGFQFYPWDSETALGMTGLTADRTGVDGAVARPYAAARANADFRMRFADRVHRHFSEGGVFYVNAAQPTWDPARPWDNPSAARFAALAAAVEAPLVGETARGGEQMGAGPYTRDQHWARARDSLLIDYFPRRAAIVLEQLRAAGLYPRTEAPVFNQRGGVVPEGFQVTLSAPAGTIYYTRDGSDPRQPVEVEELSRHLLVTGATPRRVLVPSVANGGSVLGDTWRSGAGGFDDSGWRSGTGGVGYDTDTFYTGLIGMDVEEEFYGKNGSVFIRIPFEFAGDAGVALNTMTLRVRVDDGFVAYLNGVAMASMNAPASPTWNSLATAGNADEAAVQYRAFDVAAQLPALRVGANLLAIQGFNVTSGSSDFLVEVELEAGAQRIVHGDFTAEPYAGPIAVTDLTTFKARALNGGEWSALSEATFVAGQPRLVISELHYHPANPTAAELAAGFGNDDDFEFIELYNAGTGTLDLRGVRLVDGMEFDFTGSGMTRLAPGEALLLVQNRAAFEFRYGTGLAIAGEYVGRLSNAGERIELVDAAGRSLIAFTFGTDAPWPASPDGDGTSLTLVDFEGDPEIAGSWSASDVWGGTPGRVEPPGALRIDYVRRDAAGVTLGFSGRAGKAYLVRTRRELAGEWFVWGTIPAAEVNDPRQVTLAWSSAEPSAFFQLMELP
ncbi:MAG: lamin tail domain-containing protein [Verrucomicrobia bacterium]|nr:lamin tail domain-containing protein [Verrucomicrobiota bacterium]